MEWAILSTCLLILFALAILIARSFRSGDQDRDTLPPGADYGGDPADLLASVAIRIDHMAGSLSELCRDLVSVSRDIDFVRKQQATHGKQIAILTSGNEDLGRRVADLERRSA